MNGGACDQSIDLAFGKEVCHCFFSPGAELLAQLSVSQTGSFRDWDSLLNCSWGQAGSHLLEQSMKGSLEWFRVEGTGFARCDLRRCPWDKVRMLRWQLPFLPGASQPAS